MAIGTQVTIKRVKNGYIVETWQPSRGGGHSVGMSEDNNIHIFPSLEKAIIQVRVELGLEAEKKEDGA